MRACFDFRLGQIHVALALLLAAALFAAPASAALTLDPVAACGLLADQRLPVRGGYRQLRDGSYACGSFRHKLRFGTPALHEVRYQGFGDHARVTRLQLELFLRSRGEVQPAFRELARLTGLLTERALNTPLPPEAEQAILAGTPGTWPLAGSELAVERITGAEPALRVVIRSPPGARWR
jgi:hypothetical protein